MFPTFNPSKLLNYGVDKGRNILKVLLKSPNAPPWPPEPGQPWPPANYNEYATTPDRAVLNQAQQPATVGGSLPVPGSNFNPYQLPVPGYNFNPYQLQTGDTFEAIAEKNGMTVQQIQAANNGMAVPPPKGSYINLPRPQQALINQGVPASVAARIAPQNALGGTGSFVSASGEMNLAELRAQVQSDVAAGRLPPVVSHYTPILDPTTGRPVTPQQMQDNGYTYNNQLKQWELPAAAETAATTSTGGGTQDNRTVYFSRSRGYVTPEVARLLQKKRWRRQELSRVAPAESSNAGPTPSTTLNVHIGGG